MEHGITLKQLIDTLTFSNKIHICILDMSGILCGDILSINSDNHIHSRKICTQAKLAPLGMRLCFSCKTLATHKAIAKKELISGRCPYGIFEAAKAVFVQDHPVCVVFAGNLIDSYEAFAKAAKKSVKLTRGSFGELNALVSSCEQSASASNVKNICEIVCEFIQSSINKSSKINKSAAAKDTVGGHYAVNSIINHINKFYQSNLSLKQMAKLYYLNENYLGRIFKAQTGLSFAKYLNRIRLSNACLFLKDTDMSIISISSACGFNNVTYFNRVFKNATSLTPLEYRRRS